MTYAELTQAIQDYCQNYGDEFVAEIPRITRLAEDRIYRAVQIPALRRNATSTTTPQLKYLSLPSDFRASSSLAVIDASGTTHYLLQKEISFIGEVFPSGDTGVPRFYAVFDAATILFGPAPDASYGVELHYWFEPESIVTAGTSWLGTNVESALFYGVLVEAYVFMKGDQDLLGQYRTRYDEAITLLKAMGAMVRADAFRVDMGS